MKFQPFRLERYFAEYEFKVRHLLSPSDCESLSLQELLKMADPEARQMWEELSLGYTESTGHPLLRQEISRQYNSLSPEQVIVAIPEEAIFIVMNSLLKAGDQVIVTLPAYQSLYQIAQGLGCELLPWRLDSSPTGWHIDLAWLNQNLSHRVRLVVVNFPHNPTGYLPNPTEFQSLVDLVSRSGAYLFCDEMYRGLEYPPQDRLPPACDLYERAISLSGLSKTFSLPGLRIGWLATQDRALLDQFLALKDYLTICNSAPSEILGLIALRNQAAIIQRNLEIIQANLEASAHFCQRHADLFEWLPPHAGSVAFPRWRGPASIELFCQRALDKLGVMIAPGSLFEITPVPASLAQHFRLGLGRRNFHIALHHLEQGLPELAGS